MRYSFFYENYTRYFTNYTAKSVDILWMKKSREKYSQKVIAWYTCIHLWNKSSVSSWGTDAFLWHFNENMLFQIILDMYFFITYMNEEHFLWWFNWTVLLPFGREISIYFLWLREIQYLHEKIKEPNHPKTSDLPTHSRKIHKPVCEDICRKIFLLQKIYFSR